MAPAYLADTDTVCTQPVAQWDLRNGSMVVGIEEVYKRYRGIQFLQVQRKEEG